MRSGNRRPAFVDMNDADLLDWYVSALARAVADEATLSQDWTIRPSDPVRRMLVSNKGEVSVLIEAVVSDDALVVRAWRRMRGRDPRCHFEASFTTRSDRSLAWPAAVASAAVVATKMLQTGTEDHV